MSLNSVYQHSSGLPICVYIYMYRDIHLEHCLSRLYVKLSNLGTNNRFRSVPWIMFSIWAFGWPFHPYRQGWSNNHSPPQTWDISLPQLMLCMYLWMYDLCICVNTHTCTSLCARVILQISRAPLLKNMHDRPNSTK